MYDLFERLAENGHEIHVLLRARSIEEKGTSRIGNLWLHYIRLPLKFNLHRLLAFPVFLVKAIQLCLQLNINIIYSHIFGFYGLVGTVTAKIIQKPSIHWHCALEGYFRKEMSVLDLITGYYPLTLTAKFGDILITGTNALKRHYLKLWPIDPNKIKILPNSVSLDRFNPSINGDEVRRKLNLKKDIILFVHHLGERKGPKYLIKALPYVKKELPDCVCIMVGTGPQLAELIDLVKELGLKNKKDIFFMGEVPSPDIPKFMVSTDVLVVPSVAEGFSRVIIEGMACGTPIVATTVGGTPDIITHNKTGLLVPPKNPEELARAILRILCDKKIARRLSKNAYEEVKNKYSLEAISAKFIHIVENLCSIHSLGSSMRSR